MHPCTVIRREIPPGVRGADARAGLGEHSLDQGSCGMNTLLELLGVKLDRLTRFVPARNTVARTAINQACGAAAALPEVAHDTALAMNMGTAWNHRQKARKHDPNKSRVVLAGVTNSRVDRKRGGHGKQIRLQRHEPYADCDRLLRSDKADAPKYKMPPLNRGAVYSPETAVKIALDLKDRFSQKVHVTATRLVQDKKVPGTERDVTRRVTQWRLDVEKNLKLPETGGNRELAQTMAYSSVAAWGDVGARMLESKADFEIWMQTMTADGQTIDRKAVTKHLNDVKRNRDASKNWVSVRVLPACAYVCGIRSSSRCCYDRTHLSRRPWTGVQCHNTCGSWETRLASFQSIRSSRSESVYLSIDLSECPSNSG